MKDHDFERTVSYIYVFSVSILFSIKTKPGSRQLSIFQMSAYFQAFFFPESLKILQTCMHLFLLG